MTNVRLLLPRPLSFPLPRKYTHVRNVRLTCPEFQRIDADFRSSLNSSSACYRLLSHCFSVIYICTLNDILNHLHFSRQNIFIPSVHFQQVRACILMLSKRMCACYFLICAPKKCSFRLFTLFILDICAQSFETVVFSSSFYSTIYVFVVLREANDP
jgi:hypothetical protein